jgi:hypothetical protein
MDMKNHGGMISAGETSNLSTIALCHVVANQELGEGNDEFGLTKYLSSYFEVIFTCRKILLGADGFTSPPKEVVLRIFVALKNPSLQLGLSPRTLGPMASTLTTRPPRRVEKT